MLVNFITPFLPALLGKGERLVERTVEKLGRAAWDLARGIWGKLRPAVEGKEAAREVLDDVAANPDDERARGALALQLEKLFGANPHLAQEVAAILNEGHQSGIVAGDGAVIIQGDVRADRGGVAAGRDINAGPGGIHTGWQGKD